MNKTHSHDTATPALSVEREARPTVNEYAADYYFAGDGGDHTPTEGERAMIEDAINGYLAEIAAPAPNPSPAAKGGGALARELFVAHSMATNNERGNDRIIHWCEADARSQYDDYCASSRSVPSFRRIWEAVEPVAPYAWAFEWAPFGHEQWQPDVSLSDPLVHGGVRRYRNVRPLFAHPAPEDTARLREDLAEAIRQIEANIAAIERSKEFVQKATALAQTAERERDDARKALETIANGAVGDQHSTPEQVIAMLIETARSASREGASDE